jgi:hypothetical protein
MSGKKDLHTLRRQAERLGWKVSTRPSGHLAWTPPDGGAPVITASTPGGGRSFQNTLATLKRAGLNLNKGRTDVAETKKVKCVCGEVLPSKRSLGQHKRRCVLAKAAETEPELGLRPEAAHIKGILLDFAEASIKYDPSSGVRGAVAFARDLDATAEMIFEAFG